MCVGMCVEVMEVLCVCNVGRCVVVGRRVVMWWDCMW